MADCLTDHRPVVSKFNLKTHPVRRPQSKKAPKRLDVSTLNQDSIRHAFLNDICNQMGAINLSSEDKKISVYCMLVHVFVMADCLTDHRPVVSKFNLKTHPVRRPQSKKLSS